MILYIKLMYSNIKTLSKLNSYKNLSLWDFSRESLILDQFDKERNNKMANDEKGSNKPLSRRERFTEYREDRVRKAVHAIKLCENMANRNSYEYTSDEAKIIVNALAEAIRNLRYAFDSKDKSKKNDKYFK